MSKISTRNAASTPRRAAGRRKVDKAEARQFVRRGVVSLRRDLVSTLARVEYWATEWFDERLSLAVVQARRQGLNDPRFLFEIYSILAAETASDAEASISIYNEIEWKADQASAQLVAAGVSFRADMAEVAALLADITKLILAVSTAQAVTS